MLIERLRRIVLLGVSAVLVGALSAGAAPWDEKTVLTFSEAVTLPGVTLAPGTYVFELGDSASGRHVIRVLGEDEQQVFATLQAIPMKRLETSDDIVMKFNPGEPGQAPAIKGFYYPGRLYGHEFIYPESQARQIASRTKTVVLSVDSEKADDVKQGTLHAIDAAGLRQDWREDETLAAEWRGWDDSRRARRGEANASLIKAPFEGQRIALDELEDNPDKYIGRVVSVDGMVEDILGPRVFKIDETHWGDLDGELLVVMPDRAAAIVREDDRVTVSGTVRRFARTDLEQAWDSSDIERSLEERLAKRPVIVADRIVGGDDRRALLIEVPDRESAPKPVGTAGDRGGAAPFSDVRSLLDADRDAVGRVVSLDDVTVKRTTERGLLIEDRNRQLFVLTEHALPDGGKMADGSTISIEGFVLQMPDTMPDTLSADALNRDIYVFATSVQ